MTKKPSKFECALGYHAYVWSYRHVQYTKSHHKYCVIPRCKTCEKLLWDKNVKYTYKKNKEHAIFMRDLLNIIEAHHNTPRLGTILGAINDTWDDALLYKDNSKDAKFSRALLTLMQVGLYKP